MCRTLLCAQARREHALPQACHGQNEYQTHVADPVHCLVATELYRRFLKIQFIAAPICESSKRAPFLPQRQGIHCQVKAKKPVGWGSKKRIEAETFTTPVEREVPFYWQPSKWSRAELCCTGPAFSVPHRLCASFCPVCFRSGSISLLSLFAPVQILLFGFPCDVTANRNEQEITERTEGRAVCANGE